jgi:hypothetical protein
LQTGEAKLIVVLDPCFITDGTVALNLPVAEGLELIAANLQGNQATQSVIIPMQRVASLTPGQSHYNVDLNELATGKEPVTGKQVTLNGNINALLLWNNAGQQVGFNPQNTVAYSTVVR